MPSRVLTKSTRCCSSSLVDASTRVDPVRAVSPPGRRNRALRPRPKRPMPYMMPSEASSCPPLGPDRRASRVAAEPPPGRFQGPGQECKDGRVTDGEFDVLILGAGSGGYACALRAAQLGLSVGLVEKGKLGGTCLHVGCIPTKALLHAAEVADAARDSEKFGVRATLDGIDLPGVNAYKDGVVSRLFKGLTGLIKGRGITVVDGAGRMTGPRQVTVVSSGSTDEKTYAGKHLVLASGSYSRSLPGLEIDGERVLTSEHALRLERVPASVVVLGGGVIGCEFA